ncbi:FecR family protein [Pedobacter frigidisoli]|uniref:FecR family protein n=1 Tax=Pedobacter frigidisoli TaxID=2530455 RepID=UPI002930DAE2|nr:FecR domain-containing protein [Pedobacter frigidisoli]
MDNEQAFILLGKYNLGECTDAEKALVEQSFMAFNEQDVKISFQKLQALKSQIARDLPKPMAKASFVKISIAITSAAAVIAFAVYMLMPRYENDVKASLHIAEQIFPKGNQALITLSNGKTISLDQNSKEIKVLRTGLTYADGSKLLDRPIEFQTISTPNGGEYTIVLSDGTKVWLNAATVLQYPTSFSERTERRVKLVSGEAYFEVAKDSEHPFIVSTADQRLTVLGTHFNINAYTRQIKTVLLEGSVQLNDQSQEQSALLKPGEQAIKNGSQFDTSKADVGLEVAWVNGKIKFRNADIKMILAEAERWYNIKVIYDADVPKVQLTGGISRKSSLATLLKLLQMSGIHFSLNEDNGIKTLTVKS